MRREKVRVAVIGASGYTGGELLRLLSGHSQVSLESVISSEKSVGRTIADVFPNLHSIIHLNLDALDPEVVAKNADLVFLALPHTSACQPAEQFLTLNKPVIDLSADFRLKDPEAYETWYQSPHPSPHLLKESVYGLPELHRAHIRQARLIAVPGCYPTAAILQLAPLVTNGLVDEGCIIIDAKSGVSGAGRSPSLTYHFPEAHDALHAYKIGSHRHLPEIEQELTSIEDSSRQVEGHRSNLGSILFTPHLVPLNRGILSTAYVPCKIGTSTQDIQTVYKEYYKGEQFIRLHENLDHVNPNHVRGSNFCDIGVMYDTRTSCLVTVAAIDNLVKGAAGQAVQAMNLLLGFPEELGLMAPGLFP